MDGVGVGEQEPVAVGGLGELVAGPVLARPAVGQRLAGEDLRFRQAGGDRLPPGGVVRVVVEQQQLDARVVLGEERGDARADTALLVTCRD